MLCFDFDVLLTVFLVYVHVFHVQQSSGATNPPVILIVCDSGKSVPIVAPPLIRLPRYAGLKTAEWSFVLCL